LARKSLLVAVVSAQVGCTRDFLRASWPNIYLIFTRSLSKFVSPGAGAESGGRYRQVGGYFVPAHHRRFIGAEHLRRHLSDFDVDLFFRLLPDDVVAICARFRADRRLGPAPQLLFLRASCRPLDRFAALPKALQHADKLDAELDALRTQFAATSAQSERVELERVGAVSEAQFLRAERDTLKEKLANTSGQLQAVSKQFDGLSRLTGQRQSKRPTNARSGSSATNSTKNSDA